MPPRQRRGVSGWTRKGAGESAGELRRKCMDIRQDLPDALRRVVDHARRHAELLLRLERGQSSSTWLRGRAGEVRAMVSAIIKDWRRGATEEEAVRALTAYLDWLHR